MKFNPNGCWQYRPGVKHFKRFSFDIYELSNYYSEGTAVHTAVGDYFANFPRQLVGKFVGKVKNNLTDYHDKSCSLPLALFVDVNSSLFRYWTFVGITLQVLPILQAKINFVLYIVEFGCLIKTLVWIKKMFVQFFLQLAQNISLDFNRHGS